MFLDIEDERSKKPFSAYLAVLLSKGQNCRPFEADVDQIKSLVDANRRITSREIAERLNLSNATVHKHKKRLGLISKLGIWVPHVLT